MRKEIDDERKSIAQRIMAGLSMEAYARMLWAADGQDPADARPALARVAVPVKPSGQAALPWDDQ